MLARQTYPIDKMRRLNSQHFEYNPNHMCDTVLTVNIYNRQCTKINHSYIIPQDIDFVKPIYTIYSVLYVINLIILIFYKRLKFSSTRWKSQKPSDLLISEKAIRRQSGIKIFISERHAHCLLKVKAIPLTDQHFRLLT